MTTAPKPPATITRRKVPSSGRSAYLGKATSVKLRSGVEVVLLSCSASALQHVVDMIQAGSNEETIALDHSLLVDAALCDARDLPMTTEAPTRRRLQRK